MRGLLVNGPSAGALRRRALRCRVPLASAAPVLTETDNNQLHTRINMDPSKTVEFTFFRIWPISESVEKSHV